MRNSMKKLKCVLAVVGLTIAFGACAAGSASLEVRQGWVRWLPGGLPAAGYLTIVNHGDKPVALVKASSPDYGDVMLHRTLSSGGTTRMEAIDRMTVPAHGQAALSPGNYHLMLMQATRPVAPGDQVPVTLQFSDGALLHTQLKVRPANQVN
ncbi:MAG: copper chaperone PCu(A)C [Burkholderiales bacterium]|nr:copper chaperone PCu(A)C [Burkholderiales bacterium]MDE2289449.1 copper chaperone PCu(A)C [Burkholderiales bacterium]MDE2608815.1 copper chaperone PCu(A)C [Burkholderiales bacterium]